ncbi:hypothetical protein ACIF8T_00440 [Streptomyces sp. NPDC085946]|uniref:hypothetical protein n=1 Tax=Streptomyces sp. NPDC085946 TaxID=3365744 RepID=UPI0037D03FCE
MRRYAPTSLCLSAAAAALLAVPVAAHAAAPAPEPGCAASDDQAFPLTTRIHGGPDRYEAGGGFGTWYLDLTNTTDRTCTHIHPVVVLVDARRALLPSQPQLEFYDGDRPRPVRFERTERDELVAALADDGGEAGDTTAPPAFPGFTVGPGRTLTVKLRLSFTADAAPDEVTANAAVVQRHRDDGDWVGQSGDYRFRIRAYPPPDEAETGPASPAPRASDPAVSSPFPFADELARTGPGRAYAALAGVALLLAAGGALLVARRRR